MSVHPPLDAESTGPAGPAFQPYIADKARLPELTWSAVLLGSALGIIFGASSLYLFLKVGMTVRSTSPSGAHS